MASDAALPLLHMSATFAPYEPFMWGLLGFGVVLLVWMMLPANKLKLERQREMDRAFAELDKLWKHRDTLQAHVAWARQRGERKEAADLRTELRSVDEQIRALNSVVQGASKSKTQ